MLVPIRVHIRDPLILLRRRKRLHRVRHLARGYSHRKNQTAAIAPRTSGMPTPNPTPRPTPRLLSELLSLPLPPVGVVVGVEVVVTVLVVVTEVEVDELLVLSGERLLTTNSTAGIENVWVELLQSHPPYAVQQNVSVPQAVTRFRNLKPSTSPRLTLRWVAALRASNARYILVAVAVVALGYHFGADRARSAGNGTIFSRDECEDGKSVDRETLWSTGDCLKNEIKNPKKSRSEAKGRLSVGSLDEDLRPKDARKLKFWQDAVRNQSPGNRNIASWRLQASPNRTSDNLFSAEVTEGTPYNYTAPCQGLKATLVLHRASLNSATQGLHLVPDNAESCSGYGKVEQWDVDAYSCQGQAYLDTSIANRTTHLKLASSDISSAMRIHHKQQYPLQLYAAGSASQTPTSSLLAIKSKILLNKRSKVHRSGRKSSRHWIHRSAYSNGQRCSSSHHFGLRRVCLFATHGDPDMIMTAAEGRLPTARVVAAIYLLFSTDHVPAPGGEIVICNTFPSYSLVIFRRMARRTGYNGLAFKDAREKKESRSKAWVMELLKGQSARGDWTKSLRSR
ncbi:hypothetical protein AN1609.2 [Aspergillus nidulans FGSC A4]|uniref:Uncharacterized protein n=1 Tax=Emericella nidulans (strain FGSC A4 / ATCC 38163 / CBS 112.46 / NRRL 194 / M139) TaxID=227321 RepID=Q5BCX1_EMENI|nr:hypothetical protein [Aspergillus nidulans FGSC A4]EAA64729.1 hypothetical protein AN1609.2 [Aspergillus nidulans FGSC A4]CBF85215.1 TPA: hypothetical protein ANIA_01609 [Aspergillus nidulans FGSC A4]|eukprot:XP_659213.1 hypothetical protein AN1609.2 [Aspergillus nidulans FGSC A4]